MSQLTCPKCQGSMRSYERSGITVDQCNDCRGIFLDRGELERLVDAENAWAGGSQQASPAPQPQQHGHPQQGHPQQGYAQQRPYKKRRSFLEDLFD